jgi:hypothetical protein
MLSCLELVQRTFDLRDHVNATNSFELTRIVPLPMRGYGGLLGVEARFNPLTDKKKDHYTTIMVWHGVEWQNFKDSDHPFGMEIIPGYAMYCNRPSMAKTPVTVSCNCADYYYTWWWFDKEHTSYEGPKLPAYKKVPGSTRGPRNPAKAPGICKHLIAFITYLKKRNFIKE